MAGFGKPVRDITDKLDALGNTTAAIGKGFAIGSALMTALAMFAYANEAHLDSLNVLDPWILTGLFIGGVMPFLISALTMRSVGNSAWQMVQEVRRQFKSIKGLMEGTAEPDYKRCVAIGTHAALREMVLPGVITVVLPVIVKYTLAQLRLVAFGRGNFKWCNACTNDGKWWWCLDNAKNISNRVHLVERFRCT